jgi:hypothetical protein
MTSILRDRRQPVVAMLDEGAAMQGKSSFMGRKRDRSSEFEKELG